MQGVSQFNFFNDPEIPGHFLASPSLALYHTWEYIVSPLESDMKEDSPFIQVVIRILAAIGSLLLLAVSAATLLPALIVKGIASGCTTPRTFTPLPKKTSRFQVPFKPGQTTLNYLVPQQSSLPSVSRFLAPSSTQLSWGDYLTDEQFNSIFGSTSSSSSQAKPAFYLNGNVIEVPPDGNCPFYALATLMILDGKIPTQAMLNEKEAQIRQLAGQLRQESAEQIRSHSEALKAIKTLLRHLKEQSKITESEEKAICHSLHLLRPGEASSLLTPHLSPEESTGLEQHLSHLSFRALDLLLGIREHFERFHEKFQEHINSAKYCQKNAQEILNRFKDPSGARDDEGHLFLNPQTIKSEQEHALQSAQRILEDLEPKDRIAHDHFNYLDSLMNNADVLDRRSTDYMDQQPFQSALQVYLEALVQNGNWGGPLELRILAKKRALSIFLCRNKHSARPEEQFRFGSKSYYLDYSHDHFNSLLSPPLSTEESTSISSSSSASLASFSTRTSTPSLSLSSSSCVSCSTSSSSSGVVS